MNIDKNVARAAATVAVWIAIGAIAYITKSADHVGWGVGTTFIIWIVE